MLFCQRREAQAVKVFSKTRKGLTLTDKRNEVFSRNHQAAKNYEDSEDYYGVGIFGIWELSN